MRNAGNGMVRTESKNLVDRGESERSFGSGDNCSGEVRHTFSFPTAQDDGVGDCAIRHSERRYGMTGEKCGKRNGEN